MASKDEKIGRKASSSWGPPRHKWAKKAGGKAVRRAAKICPRLFFWRFDKDEK